jgi:hypothetical protein
MNTPPKHLSEKAADATPAWPSPCNKQRSDRRRVRREEDSYEGNGRSALRALIQLGEIQVEHIEGHQAKEQQRKHENRPRDYGALDLAIRSSVVLHPNPRNRPARSMAPISADPSNSASAAWIKGHGAALLLPAPA